ACGGAAVRAAAQPVGPELRAPEAALPRLRDARLPRLRGGAALSEPARGALPPADAADRPRRGLHLACRRPRPAGFGEGPGRRRADQARHLLGPTGRPSRGPDEPPGPGRALDEALGPLKAVP